MRQLAIFLALVLMLNASDLRGAAVQVTGKNRSAAEAKPSTSQIKNETPLLDHRQLLEREKFWDNRDWGWYERHIPFFECSDPELTTTYYYRWELLTKHLTYGSPNSGYSFTEFIDRPFWSGTYGAISCPAGHQLYEARWLRDPRIAQDYLRYWFRTPGAQPRNYSTWLADSAWAMHLVHPDFSGTRELLPDLVANYRAWEQRHFVPEVGLFWQTGHDDGMEFNINSRQTADILRGAPSYRPSFNAYMWADAQALVRLAKLHGEEQLAAEFQIKADRLAEKMKQLLWDERRQFFFPVFRDEEERDGHRIAKGSRTYETGRYAGDPHGRELIGYVPWQFDVWGNDNRFDVAWDSLTDRRRFWADFGPTTVEREDPQFLLQKSCCWWSGQSWPYATSQTLAALARLLQRDRAVAPGHHLTSADYVQLLQIYSRSHRKEGRPYLAEALHPDTGSFEGHDAYNHSEHYFHSAFCDLVFTGLVGLIPQSDDQLVLFPLAPESWDYMAVENLPYRGHLLTLFWDRTGNRYGRGPGWHVWVDGVPVGKMPNLQPVRLPGVVPGRVNAPGREGESRVSPTRLTNFAVNNDGSYYPRLTASMTEAGTSLSKIQDGNYWYHVHPPNRWTCGGTASATDWLELDLGQTRSVHQLKLYWLDDSAESNSPIRAPADVQAFYEVDGEWRRLESTGQNSPDWSGHRPAEWTFPELLLRRLRIEITHSTAGPAGLTEIELWGEAELPVAEPQPPAGNLAFNPGGQTFPRATASYTDRFGGSPQKALDGRTIFAPSPMNRWTCYESPNASDWLEIEWEEAKEFGRVDLAIYDDRGGVQAPAEVVLYRDVAGNWEVIPQVQSSFSEPTGGQWNELRFPPVTSTRLKIEFRHRGQARSGVTEVMVWPN